VAIPSDRSIIACTPAAASARPSSSRSAGPAARPGHPDEIAIPGAVAADELIGALGPADRGDRDDQHGSDDDVAAGDRHAAGRRELRRGAHQLEGALLGEAAREDQHDIRLARFGAHGGEVRQRGRERAPSNLRGRQPALAQAEVDALDERVHRRHAHSSREHDRRVVPDPAHEAPLQARLPSCRRGASLRRAGAERALKLGRDRVDQGALSDGRAQRCR
jgi:hypothetical protein